VSGLEEHPTVRAGASKCDLTEAATARIVWRRKPGMPMALLASGLLVTAVWAASPVPLVVSRAFAEPVSDSACPANEKACTSLPHEFRDGACRHPAFNKEGTGYEASPISPPYEKACIAIAGSSAVRRSNELRLKFDNGTSHVFKDKAACKKESDPKCVSYMLYDFFPQTALFLVHVSYYEWQEWFLISRRDGRQEKIVAPPGYSPNRTWLASVNWNEGPDDGNNGVDIVPADFNSNEPAFHYSPEQYELWTFAGWEGDDRLSLRVTWHPGNDPAGESVTWFAEAVHKNGRWYLNRWAPGWPRP
jgi:hypothetical protein